MPVSLSEGVQQLDKLEVRFTALCFPCFFWGAERELAARVEGAQCACCSARRSGGHYTQPPAAPVPATRPACAHVTPRGAARREQVELPDEAVAEIAEQCPGAVMRC